MRSGSVYAMMMGKLAVSYVNVRRDFYTRHRSVDVAYGQKCTVGYETTITVINVVQGARDVLRRRLRALAPSVQRS